MLLGVTRRSILEIAQARGAPRRRIEGPPRALCEAHEVFLTGTTAGRLAGGERGRPSDRRRRAGPGEHAPRASASSGRLGRRARRSRTGSRVVSPALARCASSRASSLRASHLPHRQLLRRAAPVRRAAGAARDALLHRRLPLDDQRARRARERRALHARGGARLPRAAASTRSARSCSASRTCPRSASSPGCSRR